MHLLSEHSKLSQIHFLLLPSFSLLIKHILSYVKKSIFNVSLPTTSDSITSRMWPTQESSGGTRFYQISDSNSTSETDDQISDFDHHRRYSSASSVREKSTSDEEEEQ